MSPVLRYDQWLNSHGPGGVTELHTFFRGVAEARYVIRRVIRIVDEQARGQGLDPLEHQLLIQLFGAPAEHLIVKEIAHRLDVPAAVSSRLVTQLQERGFVERAKSDTDLRVTEVHITDRGREACVAVLEDVRFHIDYFQRQLDETAKQLALGVFGMYVGLAIDFERDVA